MIRESITCGITPFVSTNGLILKRRVDAMFDAGLRIITFGYYGYGQVYDSYVGKKGAWDRFEAAVTDARDRYKQELQLHISYVLNTLTCSVAELSQAWQFSKCHNLLFHVDLVHYSLPYFSEGPDRRLQFTPGDADRINQVVAELANMKRERPDLYKEPNASIRSIPDWLIKGPNMRVPCDAYNMIWVGADGSVRLCYVTFPLGNLFDMPLREMLFTAAHKTACIGAGQLACPNCHCSRDTRIVKHLPSLWRYSVGKTGMLAASDRNCT
jgi:cyclic pyranopterin phosphate synthase